jgi:hypothetical protein
LASAAARSLPVPSSELKTVPSLAAQRVREPLPGHRRSSRQPDSVSMLASVLDQMERPRWLCGATSGEPRWTPRTFRSRRPQAGSLVQVSGQRQFSDPSLWSIHGPEDRTGIKLNKGPRLKPFPRLGRLVVEEPPGSVAVFIIARRPGASLFTPGSSGLPRPELSGAATTRDRTMPLSR